MFQLWTKAPDDSQWKRGYITPNKNLPGDKKYERELIELGHAIRWEELSKLDHAH